MTTQVIMKRELFDSEVSQQSKTGFFSATDIVRSGNKWRYANKLPEFNSTAWFKSKQTTEFINELKVQLNQDVLIMGKGKNQHTWVHPFLFIDLALAISPKLKIEVYRWLYDELLKYRNDSVDSYKKMCGSLFQNCQNKSTFHRGISKTAKMIQDACGVSDWQKATEEQLKLRDRIHENIALLCDVLRNNNQAIRIGIDKALQKL